MIRNSHCALFFVTAVEFSTRIGQKEKNNERDKGAKLQPISAGLFKPHIGHVIRPK